MYQLYVFYHDRYQHISLTDLEEVTIGNQIHHTMTIQDFHVDTEISIRKVADNTSLEVFRGVESLGFLYERNDFGLKIGKYDVTIVYHTEYYPEKSYYIGNQMDIPFYNGQKEENFSLIKSDGKWFAQAIHEDVYLNGARIKSVTELRYGDIVFQGYSFIKITEDDVLTILGEQEPAIQLAEITRPTTVMKQKYPKFRRTPRMVYELPEDKVAFSFPSEESEDHGRGLWLILMPPLMMLIVIGVVAMIRPRGIFIIISIAMFGTTIVTSTFQYIKEKRKQKERKEKRTRLYTHYLENKREELQVLSAKQRDVLYYHYPSFEQMKYLTKEISERIWERTPRSTDFLHFRVGRATVPSSYRVSTQQKDVSNQEMDDLLEKSQVLVNHYSNVKNVPYVIDLSAGAMGMIGKHSIVKKEIQQIVGQLSFSQSYHDVRFVAIFDEEEYKSWEWMKWLPHFQLPHLYAKGFIYNEQTRDQLLSSIYELLKERDLDEGKEKKRVFTTFHLYHHEPSANLRHVNIRIY